MNGSARKTLWVLLVFTALYIGAIVYIGTDAKDCSLVAIATALLPGPGADSPICMRLNELGDFFAGAFAPLAFLWLAGAVFIQSKELTAQQYELEGTRRVLTEQVDETRASTEFIKQQTEILKKQQKLREQEQADEEFDEYVAGIIAECREIQSFSVTIADDISGAAHLENGSPFITYVLSDQINIRTGSDFFTEFRRSLRGATDYLRQQDLKPGTSWMIKTGSSPDQLKTLISGFAKENNNLSAAHRVRRRSYKPETLHQLFTELEELVRTRNDQRRSNPTAV